MVDDVAARLADEQRLGDAVALAMAQTSHPEVNVWRPMSLAFGDSGVALLLGVLGHDVAGHRLLAGAVGGIAAGSPLGLFDGVHGVRAAAWALSKDGARYTGLLSKLDRFVATGDAGTVAGGVASAYDLIGGITGWGAGLLAHRTAETGDALAGVVRAVGRLLSEDDEGPRAWMVVDERRAVDTGVAHGIPGLLAFASLALSTPDLATPELRDAVAWGSRWLLRLGKSLPQKGFWPQIVSMELEPGPMVGPKWCYGTAGVARALWLAGKALDDQEVLAEAVRMALEVAGADPAELPSPGLCHGLAGTLLVLRHFAWDTGRAEFDVAVRDLSAALLDRYDPDSPMGFRDVENSGAEVDNPGLLSGAAGIALALHALDLGERPWWSRLFLLG
ncbi:hypothetical protein Lesp02_78050 [Lentzea sp. NBRC 105346]|uniref:lanthionine synthetase C family protein n=1 Tax=Lentzea sp. NBRC 105346 TaxID=3032205 RepID=UPI0024A59EB8|nr:lanthionine synthetase C family protein [Lentzea sp. NBRC 105346]GLZ35618.1 hypothetical protein Lesp02_78050 [Lentzea sp. NBRC 105346]